MKANTEDRVMDFNYKWLELFPQRSNSLSEWKKKGLKSTTR